jgi:type II secretory pathway predicted ATPase ExeA
MYNSFFGFSAKPFELTPDSNFLYLSYGSREIYATLEYGITQRRGFILLVGEPGTGKTTLINAIINKSGINANFAYIVNPDLNFNELLHTILIEFGLASVDEELSKTRALHRLKTFVNEQYAADGNVVIIIDEAQCLDIKNLEKLRLLSNLETNNHKSIQILLSGQPELESTLSQKKLAQLAQRIGLRCRIEPLNERDTYEYIDHRLKVAGFSGSELFANKARHLIWKYSNGIPRVINMICENSLLIGYSINQKRIDSYIVKEAIDELNKIPLNNFDYRQDEYQDMIGAVSQGPLTEAEALPGVSQGLSEKKEQDSLNIIDNLRKKLSRNQESESVEKKQKRFRATWIALSAIVVPLIIMVFIFSLFIGSFKEFKNDYSSKLEAMKKSFQSQLSAIKNSKDEPTSDDKLSIDGSLPVTGSDVKDGGEKNMVVVKKGETLYEIILRVYGKNDPKILKAILKINPDIKDPDFIFENQIIKLPENADLD